MNVRIVAALFLMAVGGLGFVVDAMGDGDPWHMAGAALLAIVGAVFTDPKELTPTIKVIFVSAAQLVPWNRKERRSTELKPPETPDA